MLRDKIQRGNSAYSKLYDLIPEDHLLKKINQVVDFSFIYDLVQDSYCVYYGRPAHEPELLFRLLFLQVLYQLSDERVIQEAQVNLAYKWFLGLNPEDKLPDPSQLSRFRRHRLGASGVEKVLEHIVKQCVEKKLIRSKSIILDSTHTLANTKEQRPLDILTKAASRLHRAVRKHQPKLIEKLPAMPSLNGTPKENEIEMLHYLADLGEAIEALLPDAEGAIRNKLQIAKQIVQDERLLARKGILSSIDPDARFGWKSSVSKGFFGYKSHIAMTEDELITGLIVTPGTDDDGKQLLSLLEQTQHNELDVQEVLADAAYSSMENLCALRQQQIIPTIPLNPIVSNGHRKEDGFYYDKDMNDVQCPAGHWSVKKAKSKRLAARRSPVVTFYFDIIAKLVRCKRVVIPLDLIPKRIAFEYCLKYISNK